MPCSGDFVRRKCVHDVSVCVQGYQIHFKDQCLLKILFFSFNHYKTLQAMKSYKCLESDVKIHKQKQTVHDHNVTNT